MANDLHNHAAEMAYFGIMSVFPFFLLLTALLTFLPIPSVFDEAMAALRELAPGGVADVLESTVRDVSAQLKMNLVSVTAVGCIWMSIGAMGSTTRGLNKAFGLRDPRHYVRSFGLSLLMALIIGTLLVLAIAAVMASPLIHDAVTKRIDLGSFGNILFVVLRYALTLFFLLLTHAGLYWLCPAVKRSFRLFTPGALFSVSSWVMVSFGLRIYLSHFNNYDKIYGGLGAVILMLFWFYLMSLLLLLGAQIDAVLHPEYKAPPSERTTTPQESRPTRILLIALGTIVVVVGSLLFLKPESFVPTATPLGGEIGRSVRRSIDSGKEALLHDDIEAILSPCRDDKGRFNQMGLASADVGAIARYLKRFETIDIGSLEGRELHALLLNLSNAAALKIIMTRSAYSLLPDGLTHAERGNRIVQIGGEWLSINDITHRLLRPFFKDARDLFCLQPFVTTPFSLTPVTFTGADIDQQLDLLTVRALATDKLEVSDGAVILPVFIQRYADDFDHYSDGLQGFCVRYMTGKAKRLIALHGIEAIRYR